MRTTSSLLSCLLFPFLVAAQKVGIGTNTPLANLEVRHPLKSVIRISSTDFNDTTSLVFSNRNDVSVGKDMAITFLQNQGMAFTSSSLFPYGNSDSILFLTPSGFVGVNTRSPYERLDVNGKVRSNGALINGTEVLELGAGLTKGFDNGSIGLNTFGENNTLSIVGGGVDFNGNDRRIKFWADSEAVFTGRGYFMKQVGIGTTPTGNMLTVSSGNGSLVSLRNSSPLNIGVNAAILFGGNSYTTGIIQTIGNSSNNARMAFSTGYSFSGGASFMQERLTIANNGNIGVRNTDPQATLDIGGSLRFSGSSPAAFTLTLRGNMMFRESPTFSIDSSSINTKYIRIDHPYCNNDPDAIILVTPLDDALPLGVRYRSQDGYWYMRYNYSARPDGHGTLSYRVCTPDPNYVACNEITTFKSVTNYLFLKDIDQWNILIMKK